MSDNPRQENKKSRSGLITTILIAGLLIIYLLFDTNSPLKATLEMFNESQPDQITQQDESTTQQESVDEKQSTEDTIVVEFEEAIIGAVETAQEAVVSISNYQNIQHFNEFGLYGHGFDNDPLNPTTPDTRDDLQLASHGSGVVYKVEGERAYVITNNHVIDGNDALQVIMFDGEIADAELIGFDSLTDLAVLAIDAEYVTKTIEFADSDDVKVGSLAIAIGSPLNSAFASSVTQGIVSGLNRAVPIDIDHEANLLQTDAAINPGNSGGALVNKHGELIGINSSKFGSAVIEGMGFAIPSNDVQAVVTQLEEHGEVVRPVLGVTVLDLEHISAEILKEQLNIIMDQPGGVLVQEVIPQSSADKADIKVGDVITSIDEEAIININDLRERLYTYQVNDEIVVEIIRDGKQESKTVILEGTQR